MNEYIVEIIYSQYGEGTVFKEKLVRCKDCKYFNGNDDWCDYDRHVYNEDFCSSAERKEE